MILILSTQADMHSRAVIGELNDRGKNATLLDLSEFPQKFHSCWHYKTGNERSYRLSALTGEVIDLDQSRVIWWRRPQPFELHPELASHSYRNFAYTEIYEAFSGMWHSLDAFWINKPSHDDLAHRKVLQLKVAQEVGLPIPQTLITSNPQEAKLFYESQKENGTVYKAFSATEQQWRETRLLKPEELGMLNNLKFAPVIFQEYVPAEYDLRITVVGRKIFAAAIHSQQTSYKVDMRMDIGNAKISAVELPVQTKQLLREFMQRLGLVYGAIDMRLTPEGKYVFLEINPAGQWLFIEEKTKQTITAHMAQLMLDHDN